MTITGQVIDLYTKEGLPSASISVKNSSVGTTADSQGIFSLTSSLLDNPATQVEVSYTGYTSLIMYGFQATGQIPLSNTGKIMDNVEVVAKIMMKKPSVIYLLLSIVIITILIILYMRTFKYMNQLK